MASNRSFGLLLSAALLLLGVIPALMRGRPLNVWALSFSVALLAAAVLRPSLLDPLRRLWMWIGDLLHRFTSPLILGALFFLVITPTGLIMRALGKRPLGLRFDRAAKTYWLKREPPGPSGESFKDQF